MNVKSIRDKKLTLLLIGMFILLGASLIIVNHYESKILSGTRSYIEGESKWSNAQKQATLALVQYIITQDSIYYDEFNQNVDVINGDRIARIQLDEENTDYEIVYNGFLRGGNLPENIPHLIWLYENFSSFSFVARAKQNWMDGEAGMDEMNEVAKNVHELINNGAFTQSSMEQTINRIYQLDKRLTNYEESFSNEFSRIGSLVATYVYWINMIIVLILISGAALFIVYQFKKIGAWTRKIRQSEMRFRNVLNHSRDVIYQLDIQNGEYLYMSPSVKEITGYEIEEFTEGGVLKVLSLTHPEDANRMKDEVVDYAGNDAEMNLKQDSEFRIKHKAGHYIWINNKRALLRDEDGKPMSIIGNVRDITDRKKALEELDQSLKEKEMLLSEIHHRVKNNLSIVSSLVELQKSKLKAEDDEDGLNDIQSRIKSIALVHEKLYENETFADVDVADYIEELVDMIYRTFDSNQKKIALHKNLDSIIVDVKKAVPLGLICNELINNCYKYAFKDRKEGIIDVSLNVNGREVEFVVSDNGVGLPDNFEEMKGNSLGLTLIQVLTKQINGKLDYSSENGARFSVQFQVDNLKA